MNRSSKPNKPKFASHLDLRFLPLPLPSIIANCSLFIVAFFSLDCDSLKTQQDKKTLIHINGQTLRVEVANTPLKREQGLMYRSAMRFDEGMLFVFPHPKRVSFWMKNTLIPLDIGYFNQQRHLIEHMTMQPDDGEKTYPSSDLSLYAVETNAGWFDKQQIKKNALLKLPYKIIGH